MLSQRSILSFWEKIIILANLIRHPQLTLSALSFFWSPDKNKKKRRTQQKNSPLLTLSFSWTGAEKKENRKKKIPYSSRFFSPFPPLNLTHTPTSKSSISKRGQLSVKAWKLHQKSFNRKISIFIEV